MILEENLIQKFKMIRTSF